MPRCGVREREKMVVRGPSSPSFSPFFYMLMTSVKPSDKQDTRRIESRGELLAMAIKKKKKKKKKKRERGWRGKTD